MLPIVRVVGFLLVLSSAVNASARDLLMFMNRYDSSPFIECNAVPYLPYCVAEVVVYARSVHGLRSVTFSAPPPACLGEGVLQFDFTTPHRVVGGAIATGITLEFDSCLVSTKNQAGYIIKDIFIGRISVRVQGGISCCPFFPLPDPTALSRRIEGRDCESNHVILNHQGVTFNFIWDIACGTTSVPYGEYPQNDSEVPPGMVTLDWDCGMSAGNNLGEFIQIVRMGTEPINLKEVGWHVEPPYVVGPLDPNQTYYWRVVTSVDFGGVTGPLWSFTTGPALPVKSETWGKVKSLYRRE